MGVEEGRDMVGGGGELIFPGNLIYDICTSPHLPEISVTSSTGQYCIIDFFFSHLNIYFWFTQLFCVKFLGGCLWEGVGRGGQVDTIMPKCNLLNAVFSNN